MQQIFNKTIKLKRRHFHASINNNQSRSSQKFIVHLRTLGIVHIRDNDRKKSWRPESPVLAIDHFAIPITSAN